MDWRILESNNFLPYSLLSSLSNDTSHKLDDHKTAISLTEPSDSKTKPHIILVDHKVKLDFNGQSNYILLNTSLLPSSKPKAPSGYARTDYTLVYAYSDVRYILPYKASLLNAFEMTPSNLLPARIRKFGMLSIERLGLKFILPTITLYTNTSSPSLIEEICNKVNCSAKDACLFTGTLGLTRRLTLQIKTKQGFCYAKISTNNYSRKKIEAEISILKEINKLGFSQTAVPNILAEGKNEKAHWFLQSSYAGNKFKTPKSFSKNQISLLNDLASFSTKRLKLKDHFVHQSILSNTAYIKLERSDELIDILNDKANLEYQLAHSHGDFTSWNLKVNKAETFIYDWEAYQEDQLPLFDFFHYFIQEGILINKTSAEIIYEDICVHYLKYRSALYYNEEVSDLDIILLLYLLSVRIEYNKLLEIENPGFVQVAWQEQKRSDLIYLVTQKIKDSSNL